MDKPKRKPGRPRKIPGPVPVDSDSLGINVAEAVLWAAEHMNERRMTQRKAGSKIKYTYWKLGQENPEALLVNLVPKAWVEIGKHRKPDDHGDMAEAERKSIAELEELLAGALEEAGL
jgi:hypothetical protein